MTMKEAMDYNTFFSRKSDIVAKDLLGKRISRITNVGEITGTIAETGAYEGGKITHSRAGMLYAPGTLFLMPFRGLKLLNIATDKSAYPSCIEIRKLWVPGQEIKGPGAISKFLGFECLEGKLICHESKIYDCPISEEFKITKVKGKSENCLGYFSLTPK